MSTATPTPAVIAIGNINISGNVTPSAWWHCIKLPSGRSDSTAITLLSDIVYWYRPAEVRNEMTGALVGYRKRFHGDKLQRSYQAFADQFGFSKRETTDALKRLRDAGLINLELRTIQTQTGVILSNVLFVEPIAERIASITAHVEMEQVLRENVTPPTLKRNTPLRSNVTPPTSKSETYTEITTKTTHTEISTDKTLGAQADASTPTRSARREYSPDFETAWLAYPKRAGGNPKPSAYKAWNARLHEGVAPETLLAGVKRYAAFVVATGKLGSEYVKQAATFFGPDRHFEETWQAPAVSGGARYTQPPVSGFEGLNYGESGCNW